MPCNLVDAQVGVRAVRQAHRRAAAADLLHGDAVGAVPEPEACARSTTTIMKSDESSDRLPTFSLSLLPPSSSGTVIACSPMSPISFHRSTLSFAGNALWRSMSAASGAITPDTNLRISERKSERSEGERAAGEQVEKEEEAAKERGKEKREKRKEKSEKRARRSRTSTRRDHHRLLFESAW